MDLKTKVAMSLVKKVVSSIDRRIEAQQALLVVAEATRVAAAHRPVAG
jgi:hypothetical protein